MYFGKADDFGIESYHEPSELKWAGCGRLAMDIQSVRIGDIRENHCSLFHSVDCFRNTLAIIESLWDETFNGLSDLEIFHVLNRALYDCDESSDTFLPFDFLTNTGEHFDDAKTFIICRPSARLHILYQWNDETIGSASCSLESFRHTTRAFVAWFDHQVENTAPPYFPVDPFADER
jgi:hypothetical protein